MLLPAIDIEEFILLAKVINFAAMFCLQERYHKVTSVLFSQTCPLSNSRDINKDGPWKNGSLIGKTLLYEVISNMQ